MDSENKFKILIVDDERSNIVALNHILKPTYTTLAAIDGKSGLEFAQKSQPDLVLLDIMMPDMTGYDVLNEMKRCEHTQGIPVMFITGLDNIEDEEIGLRLGAVDYITKPFHDSIIKARVKNQLQIVSQMRTIERMGLVDPLIGIPNRRGYDRQISLEWSRAMRIASPLSILLIDIDQLKVYNDTYGHLQGDAMLKTFSTVFERSLKRAGDFAARIGGDEFAVLLPNTPQKGALEIAETIRANTEVLYIPGSNGETKITVSIGVNTHVPQINDSLDEFINKADEMLYRAKNSGRNKIYGVGEDTYET